MKRVAVAAAFGAAVLFGACASGETERPIRSEGSAQTEPGPTIPIDHQLAVVADPQPPWAGEPDSSCAEWVKHPSGLYSSRCVTRSGPP